METLVHQLLVVTLGAVLCVGAWTGGEIIHDALNLGATLTSFVFHIATTKKMDQTALIKLLLDLFALMYVVNGFSHAILLRYSSSKFGLGLQILDYVVLGGVLVSRSYMVHAKLALVVSPGKTLVGAIAGVLSSVATDLLPPLDVVPFAHQIVLEVDTGSAASIRCGAVRTSDRT
ncbi:Phosphatidate cytidylyltransferase [Phytophthora megakarya]|uniref:Phosphatidate cytidylyltransferase n=1 Tax=Phytophthora megakarya TaxID=4795 RepID=A0A225UQI2_9STRA|nr:Phosphatidate cytidylyltransferase [Phytophthora megakarya]